ncbi:hypothetical protein Ahy_B06g083907 [Arachis hypogaea]|uniref:Uncharacterized protein n=1 Tax=Arachis hypogaea TaxID=3818 RepID=A0A444YQL2_ARAHY|nr:hypothetical protein Ahy_B06g083907 [Arachis hypogaea]
MLPKTQCIYTHGRHYNVSIYSADKNENHVHLQLLSFVEKLDEMDKYSRGSAPLGWLYRCMYQVANKNVTNLARPLQLL